MANDNGSLSHTKWNCKYHIVFAPKYRRQVVYRQIKADIGRIIRQLCEMKKAESIEAEACPDHIHMLDSVYLRSSQNSQPNSDASDVNSRKERGRVFRIARSDPPPAF